jgi:hypothetical protein
VQDDGQAMGGAERPEELTAVGEGRLIGCGHPWPDCV